MLLLVACGSSATTSATPTASTGGPGSSTVLAGSVTITGLARGFEANINVSVLVAGSATRLGETTALAGNFDTALPYSVTVDVSAAKPGDVAVIVVHGGAGLETDPGDFSAVPVLIGH